MTEVGYAIFGVAFAACYIWTCVLAFRVSVGWGFITMVVPCGQLVFTIKHWDQAKIPFLLRLPVLAVPFLYGFVQGYRSSAARGAARAAAARAAAVSPHDARVGDAPSVPDALDAAQKAAPPLPTMGGVPVDLSTIMGRARALADAWQRDAALTGIEATHVSGGVVQTAQGGVARLTFGPSPFADTGRRLGSFLVTYDATGLHSESPAGAAGSAKSLVEPMCAPEEAYRRAAADSGAPLTLRYTFDARRQRAVWLALDATAVKVQSKAFDGQNCALVGQ